MSHLSKPEPADHNIFDVNHIRINLRYTLIIIGIGWILLILSIMGNNIQRQSATFGFFILSIPTAWVTWRLTIITGEKYFSFVWLSWILRLCAIIHIIDWLIFYALGTGWVDNNKSYATYIEHIFGTFPIFYLLGCTLGSKYFSLISRNIQARFARWVFQISFGFMVLMLLSMGLYMIWDWSGYLQSSLSLSRAYFTNKPASWEGSGGIIWTILLTGILSVWVYSFYLMIERCKKFEIVKGKDID